MMTIDATACPPSPSFPWKRFGSDFLYATMFNVGVALAIKFLLPFGQFWRILVTSMCIGTVAFLFIDGSRLYLARGEEKHNWPRMIGIIAVAVPTAQTLGGWLSELLLGMSFRTVPEVISDLSGGGLLFVLLATGVATAMFSSRERLMQSEARAARESARAEAVARQALQAQLQLLQAQMEPHMLFNTLANLQGLIGLNPARAQQMLDQLIVYLRATLSSSRAEVTTLAQEFSLMEAYLGLMSVRMGERLSFTLDLPADLRGAHIPPMLLQPLIENAISHGLEPKIEGGRIAVSATTRDGKLHVCVLDDGLGLGAASAKAGTQLGLANTRSRLNAIHGEQASLALTANAGGGVRAELTLPLVLP
jgi:sensor histidine kinase YesM